MFSMVHRAFPLDGQLIWDVYYAAAATPAT
jgi:hypothetical protein